MFVTPFLRQARRAGGSKSFRSAADEWIKSAWGRRARIGVLAASTVAYPIGILLWNGPLVGFVFKRRWSVEEVPSYLERVIKEEFDAWREREGRDEKDAHVKFFVQRQFDDIDSIRAGSMGVRFGARIALPCFAQFTDFANAQKYCESKLEPLYVLKRPIGMVWDSTYAKELLKTFVLSENALRFLIQRDLMSQDGYQAFANKAISWASFNTFASLLIYWIHLRRPNPTALSFVVIYTIFMTLGILGGNEWHKLYKYMTDMHADSTAARLSADYCAGGIEYYMKLLKRNQLLRALLDDGSRLFTPAGDKLRTDTSYVLRFSLLKDATHEFSELAPVVEGDDHNSVAMSTVVGLAACAVSSLFFGSMFVPIKRCKPGDGIFVQFIMCSSIFTVGLFVYLMRQLPQFQPFAMIGGAAWCIGNLTAVPVIRNIGLGLGVLIWGVVNCTVGWAIGRFGLFGTKASEPQSNVLNFAGLAFVILGGILFSQVKSAESQRAPGEEEEGVVGLTRPVPVVTTHAEVHAPAPILEAVSTREVVDGAEQQPSGEIEVVDGERAGLVHPSPALPNAHEQPADGAAKKQKMIGILLSLVAGICYGITFTPVIYIQDNPEKFFHPPKDAIDYVFSHYCGIYLTSISVLIVYVAFKRNRPFVDPQIIGPSLLAGVLWSIAQIAWFVANDSLSQAITFPINSMVPGVIATLWSVLYFKEITGRRNLQFLTVAVVITLFGAALVGLSKSL